MAKGLRASVKKNNRQLLRARVFRPVDDQRTARLSAKLLELAQQPRPSKTEMEVESEKGTDVPQAHLSPSAFRRTDSSADTASEQPADPAQQPEGLSYHLACPVPASLSDSEGDSDGEEDRKDEQGEEDDSDSLFYSILGLGTDIGFDEEGELIMHFDHDLWRNF
jgi:hypothetical protein